MDSQLKMGKPHGRGDAQRRVQHATCCSGPFPYFIASQGLAKTILDLQREYPLPIFAGK
jgi:hypothetical protein